MQQSVVTRTFQDLPGVTEDLPRGFWKWRVESAKGIVGDAESGELRVERGTVEWSSDGVVE
jgi:hypothetical protein